MSDTRDSPGETRTAAETRPTTATAVTAPTATSAPASPRSARRREWLGNALACALLLALAVALVPLHDDAWWSAMPRPSRWWLALGSVVVYAACCIGIRVRTSRGAHPDAAASTTQAVLVAYASQTGFAQALAERTADALVAAGVAARCRDLGRIDAATLDSTSRALFVVSTTGEGDPPDHALAFVRDTMATAASLPRLRYAVLALGDRQYTQFCGFGHRLDTWLRHGGAQPLFDVVEVDNGDAGALRHWQHHLGRLADAPEMPDWAPAAFADWTLVDRREANAGSVGGAAFNITLRPGQSIDSATAMPDWQAGDIAEIGPRHAPADLADVLATLGLDGDARVSVDGGSTTLAELLSRSHLPDVGRSGSRVFGAAAADACVAELPAPDSVEAWPLPASTAAAGTRVPQPLTAVRTPADAQALADTLVALPHREYSIASLPADGTLELLVRRMQRPDGRAGLGSGWLCDIARPGDTIALRVRRNANFHPPDPVRPMILIGNGTGIAGLRAHLKARAASGARGAWLLFGERSAAHDGFFGDEIDAWQTDGTLSRVDLTFSRDQPERRYVQHALRDAADTLRTWVADGAAIYVCGSLEGMAPAVDATLREALGDAAIDAMLADGRYRRDVY